MKPSISSLPTVKRPAVPALRAVVVLAAGMYVCGRRPFDPIVCALLLTAAVCALVITYRRRGIGDICAVSALFFAGATAWSFQSVTEVPALFPRNLVESQIQVEGIVENPPRYYPDTVYLNLRCRKAFFRGGSIPLTGIVPVRFNRTPILLCEGTHLVVQGTLKKQPAPVFGRFPASPRSAYTGFPFRLSSGPREPAPVVLGSEPSFFGIIRSRASSLIGRYSFGGHGDVMRAMLIGDRTGLAQSTTNSFSRAGIAHLLAVSGLHAGIILIAVTTLLGPFHLTPGARVAVTLVVLFLYTGICGFNPPIARTFVMLTLITVSTLIERPRNTENALFIALMLILAVNPQSFYSPSLHLSFAAVWAIITFYQPVLSWIRHRFGHIRRTGTLFTSIISGIIVSTLAFTATAPIVAYHFGALPLLSIAVNVAAVPCAFMIVYGGLATLAASMFGAAAEPLAYILSAVTGIMLNALVKLAEFTSALPFAALDIPDMSVFASAGLLIWLYVLSRSRERTYYRKALLYIPLIVVAVLTWRPLLAGERGETRGTVVFFDVGQGDSALIRAGNGRFFLIDTGVEHAARTVVVPSLKNLGVPKLDGVVLSHLDADHAGGVAYLLDHIVVGRIFCRESVADSLTRIFGERVTGLAAGDSIAFDGGGGLVLGPAPSYKEATKTSENNRSLLVRFTLGERQVLFTGDIKEPIQKLMVTWGARLRSDVLKVPHHGAYTLVPEFVETVAPHIAIISCGLNNRYGHPAESTLVTLSGAGAAIFRTDSNGTIEISLHDLGTTSE